jgi:serine/threonine protein kinase
VRWHEIARLGSGNFGTVFKALNLDSGKMMAVKLMTRTAGPTGDWLWGVLKREIEILSRISHVSGRSCIPRPAGLQSTSLANILQAHIVDYIDSQGWEDGKSEIFMGFNDGTLESLILGGGSTVPARTLAVTVLHHMLQAIDFLAVHGIIHRDLKPENILYVSRGQYHFQLGDFGLSNTQANATTHAGTPVYMTPEFFSGGRQSSKADVWSLYITILWTLDIGGFRRLAQRASCFDEVKAVALPAANSPELANIREMARIDPEARASAAQMLVKCYDGVGLTTPRSQVPLIVEEVPPARASRDTVDPDTPMPDAAPCARASAGNTSRNAFDPRSGTKSNAPIPSTDANRNILPPAAGQRINGHTPAGNPSRSTFTPTSAAQSKPPVQVANTNRSISTPVPGSRSSAPVQAANTSGSTCTPVPRTRSNGRAPAGSTSSNSYTLTTSTRDNACTPTARTDRISPKPTPSNMEPRRSQIPSIGISAYRPTSGSRPYQPPPASERPRGLPGYASPVAAVRNQLPAPQRGMSREPSRLQSGQPAPRTLLEPSPAARTGLGGTGRSLQNASRGALNVPRAPGPFSVRRH